MESSFFSHHVAVTLDFPAAFRALHTDGRWALQYWTARIRHPATTRAGQAPGR